MLKQLIDSLIENPKTEREFGRNDVLISLIKKFYPTSRRDIIFDSVRSFGVTPENITQIDQFLKDGQKLGCVKLIKELTNLGLKEAKDLTDKLDEDLRLKNEN